MRKFRPADFLPGFVLESSVSKEFNFDLLAGRQIVLAFVGNGRSPAARSVCETLLTLAPAMKSRSVLCYVVTWDRGVGSEPWFETLAKAFTIFWDTGRRVHRAYGKSIEDDGVEESIGLFVLRENLRLHSGLSAAPVDTLMGRLTDAMSSLPEPGAFETIERQAPVLMVPDVFEPGFCRVLCDHYRAQGGSESGFMRDVDGVTKPLLNPKQKRRRDCQVNDEAMVTYIRTSLHHRLRPEIKKAFAFDANRIERYTIGCYDGADLGFFGAHRDNTTKGTSHRRFAVTINLNAEDYEGGELWFPEYGRRLYKPATGSAVVFSCSLLHEARPVTKGTRFALLPFLYDDAAAEIRRANFGFISEEKATPVEGGTLPVAALPVGSPPPPGGDIPSQGNAQP